MLDRFEQFIGGIFSIHRIIQKIEREEMEKYGLKGGYALYLAAMSQYPEGVTAAQLSEICDRDKAAVSRALSEMENRGLLRRPETDRVYRARIFLSDAGNQAAGYVCDKISSAVSLASRGLTEDDKAVFYSVLTRFSANLQNISRDGLPKNSDH